MLLLIPLFPFLGFLINAGVGRRLSKSVSGLVAVGAMVASFVVAVVSVVQLVGMPAESRAIVQTVFSWITSGSFRADFTLRVDPLSSLMILVVTGIGSLIHIYSTSYMHEEPDSEYARYFSYLNLFASFMLILVLGANFLVMFVGWEGVGLCSYLLIGFYYVKKSASDAGKKAFIVNRIGDFGFVLGVLMLFVKFGTIDFQQIAQAAGGMTPEAAFGTISLATLLLFVGATGKSAQIPLYVWLPDAMEGPDPGLRAHPRCDDGDGWRLHDRAQRGPLQPRARHAAGGRDHWRGDGVLRRHDRPRAERHQACARVLHRLAARLHVPGHGRRRVRRRHLPPLHARVLQGAALPWFRRGHPRARGRAGHPEHGRPEGQAADHLLDVPHRVARDRRCAVPPGFFSKDEILFRTFSSGHTILWVVGMLTSLMTATYMFRLVFLTFHGERRHAVVAPAHAEEEESAAHGGGHGHGGAHDAHGHDAHGHDHLHDAPRPMAFALIVLTIGSVLAGYIGLPHALGGSNRLEQWLEPSFTAPHAAPAQAGLRTMEPTDTAPAAAEPAESHGEEASAGVELGLMGRVVGRRRWPASGSRGSSSCPTRGGPTRWRGPSPACGRCC